MALAREYLGNEKLTRLQNLKLEALVSHMLKSGSRDPHQELYLHLQKNRLSEAEYLNSIALYQLVGRHIAASAEQAADYVKGLDKKHLKAYAASAKDYAGQILNNINGPFNPFRRGLTLRERCTAFTRDVLTAYAVSIAGCGRGPNAPEMPDANPAYEQLTLDQIEETKQAKNPFEAKLSEVNPLLRVQYEILKKEYESGNTGGDFDVRVQKFFYNMNALIPGDGAEPQSEALFENILNPLLKTRYQQLKAESRASQNYSPEQLENLDIQIAGFFGDVFQQQPRASKVATLSAEPVYIGTRLAADFDLDGKVQFGDFIMFAMGFDKSIGQAGYDAGFDLDGDGRIGFGDFILFAMQYGFPDIEAPKILGEEIGKNTATYPLSEPIREDQLGGIEVYKDGSKLSSGYSVYFSGSQPELTQKSEQTAIHTQISDVTIDQSRIVVDTSNLEPDNYEVRFDIADPAGNNLQDQRTITIEEPQDTTPPTTAGLPASVEVDEGSVAPSIYLRGKVSDNKTPFSELEKTAQGSDLVPVSVRNDSLVFARPLVNPYDANGTTNVVLTVKDQAGNSTQVVIPYTVNPKPDLEGNVSNMLDPSQPFSSGTVIAYPVGGNNGISAQTDFGGNFSSLQLPGPGTYELHVQNGNNIRVVYAQVPDNNDHVKNILYVPGSVDAEFVAQVVMSMNRIVKPDLSFPNDRFGIATFLDGTPEKNDRAKDYMIMVVEAITGGQKVLTKSQIEDIGSSPIGIRHLYTFGFYNAGPAGTGRPSIIDGDTVISGGATLTNPPIEGLYLQEILAMFGLHGEPKGEIQFERGYGADATAFSGGSRRTDLEAPIDQQTIAVWRAMPAGSTILPIDGLGQVLQGYYHGYLPDFAAAPAGTRWKIADKIPNRYHQ